MTCQLDLVKCWNLTAFWCLDLNFGQPNLNMLFRKLLFNLIDLELYPCFSSFMMQWWKPRIKLYQWLLHLLVIMRVHAYALIIHLDFFIILSFLSSREGGCNKLKLYLCVVCCVCMFIVVAPNQTQRENTYSVA